MRKHSVRKWLHAILDLLPVILIPVFMIYSHRHTMTEQTQVDIQYKYQSNEINTIDDLILGNLYFFDKFRIDEDYLLPNEYLYFYVIKYDDVSFSYDDAYGNFDGVYNQDTFITFISIENNLPIYFSVSLRDINDVSYQNFFVEFTQEDTFISYTNCYLIFTEDNDLSIVQNAIISAFNDDYTSMPQYTDYNVIESVQVEDTNSSVTSVFMNNFTNTVDTYFNFNNTFNLGDIWTWIDTNLFSGNSPAIAFSIWNIICYEFLMDLLFVFYAFFMFLMDFVECVLEKPFNRINRR